jgi:hypothetical protein
VLVVDGPSRFGLPLQRLAKRLLLGFLLGSLLGREPPAASDELANGAETD